jgi:hypothetical protein
MPEVNPGVREAVLQGVLFLLNNFFEGKYD